ncbi:MAG: hypothetical protein COB07_03955 [Sulfurovum sp.]|nr:MAG: hypothetical protein COB07_03955 [Sulfurovum sp.]
MKKIFLYFFVLMLLMFVILLSYTSDEQRNSYKNLQAVLSDNAIERGWIPEILPESAYDIVEIHNLDTNVFYGSFYYKEKDEAKLMKHLTLISESKNTYK